DGSRFGIALDHDEAAQHGSILAGHLLPDRLAAVGAERNPAILDLRGEQDAPAVLRHPDEAEFGPTLTIDADGGTQIDFRFLETARTAGHPPVEIAGVPFFQRALEARIAGQVDVVRDQVVVVDFEGHQIRSLSYLARAPEPYFRSAPSGPAAAGRWKIQFCHALRRPKILVSMVSGPGNRTFASSPVSESGEKLSRSSIMILISSSQSISS